MGLTQGKALSQVGTGMGHDKGIYLENLSLTITNGNEHLVQTNIHTLEHYFYSESGKKEGT